MAFSNGTDLILDFTEQFAAIDGAVQRVLERPPSAPALQPRVRDAAGEAG
jgi:hypothetical protein